MSLLAALAKGFGAGTINNAKAGFAEQQRLREAAQRKEDMLAQSTQRKEEMTEEYNRRDAQLKTQIEANQADTEARLAAQSSENAKQREHDLSLWERKYAADTQAAVANANVRARESHAKNIMGTMDQLAKRKAELMENDKITDEQRATAAREIDMLGYTLAADPGAQQLLGEFGGGGYASYWLSLAPEVSGKGGSDGGGEKGGEPEVKTAPAARPGYTKPGYGGLIGSIQQKAAPDSFWNGRETERSLYEKFNGAAPAATMTHNAQSPAAVEAYKNMYK
ncbi:hypothetical protein [Aeromonas veronii]|uniref:hypothetical protein n=1 Tax=Aeromonas veronii TaxID=654 RepID=UPI00224694D1|nr:hypothetical protein [Aeromonas veronii]MCX0443406.1 hypothetical protein [Aeromonas veronii]